ncbi:hypothetical protein SAMD00019534_001080 [Acytostelium subglobosum LB1]|uniref:hypothetical protein n=1 Tax=Acytostelium subglobosum LB1 TaxID=1410327 RepID=UPI000644DA7C|nr:hypothetical protein SAMD00019534_001080 [Acytostelium subglobosum LB1]GAM16933.1 hypothetical protein SAMD00019534_001080 [Acytostelium subglobosum LB1]|eukprot:XP_012758995.1 hypothetical protein SAMD00019534_001080 [Acytostelium subglobosum LB1]
MSELTVLLGRLVIDNYWPMPRDLDEVERFAHRFECLRLALVCWSFHSIVKSKNNRLILRNDALKEYVDSLIDSPFCVLSLTPATIKLDMAGYHLEHLIPSHSQWLGRLILDRMWSLHAPIGLLPPRSMPGLTDLNLVIYDDLSTGLTFDSELDILRLLSSRLPALENLKITALLDHDKDEHYGQLMDALRHNCFDSLKVLWIDDDIYNHGVLSFAVLGSPSTFFSALRHFSHLERLILGIAYQPGMVYNTNAFYKSLIVYLEGATSLCGLELKHFYPQLASKAPYRHIVQHPSNLTYWLMEVVRNTIPTHSLARDQTSDESSPGLWSVWRTKTIVMTKTLSTAMSSSSRSTTSINSIFTIAI